VAFAGVLWPQPLYYNLGVEWEMKLMDCCCVVCVGEILAFISLGIFLGGRVVFPLRTRAHRAGLYAWPGKQDRSVFVLFCQISIAHTIKISLVIRCSRV
jgi:hypothetical protein